MKAHVRTDRRGLVHTLVATPAGAADITPLPQLLHGEERELYGDQAYWSEMHRMAAQTPGVRDRTNRRPAPGRRLRDRAHAAVYAGVAAAGVLRRAVAGAATSGGRTTGNSRS